MLLSHSVLSLTMEYYATERSKVDSNLQHNLMLCDQNYYQ